jgi:branched-chain amino acid transport system permease protein
MSKEWLRWVSNTYFYKLAIFVISGATAGLAGFLFAVKDGFVNPELLSGHQSGQY